MTKHLRFLFVTLLAWVCAVGGYAQTTVFEETFQKCTQKGGYDNNFSAGATSTKLQKSKLDNDWIFNDVVYEANKCVRFSSAKVGASFKTPEITETGDFVLTFSAAGCTDKSATLGISADNATLSTKSVSLTAGKFTDYLIDISNATAPFEITFTGKSKQQCYFGNVKIVKKADTNPAPELSFAKASEEVELHEAIIEPQTLEKPADFDGDVVYSSSDENVAKVVNGNIELYKTGKTTITATTSKTGKYSQGTASYELNVVDSRSDAGVSVKEEAVTVDITKEDYDANSNITNANGVALTFKSSNEDVVDISKDGKAVLYKEGSAVISVSYAGNNTYKPVDLQFTLNVADNRTTDSDFKFDKDEYRLDLNGQSNVSFSCKDKLSNPNSLKVTYSGPADNRYISVDAETGDVVVSVCGTYKITAVGSGDKYKETTATCTLEVVDGTTDEVVAKFVAGINKGTKSAPAGGTGKVEDEVYCSPITIHSSNAAFAAFTTSNNKDVYTYRMYNDGETTVSTRVGNIVKIEFVGNGNTDDTNKNTGKYKGNTLKALTAEGYVCTEPNYGVWTGSAKEVKFTATAQARATDIKVTVIAPAEKAYTYDQESDANSIEKYGNATVTLNRPLVSGKWNTLCLPFALDKNQIAEKFGEGTKVAELDYEKTTGTTVAFKEAATMQAATPYLIMPTEAATKLTFENVAIAKTEPDYSFGDNNVEFKGVYSKTDISADSDIEDGGFAAFLGKDNTLHKPTAGTMLRGFRAFFVVPAELANTPVNVAIDGVVTSLKNIDAAGQDADAPVYNLQGQRVDGKTLVRGIYVKAGKKFVVK